MREVLIQFLFVFIVNLGNNSFGQQFPVLKLIPAIENPENIKISDFVESITYIPLATTFDCLVDDNPKVFVTKEYIVTVTTLRCLVFNRENGEFIREITHNGRGPGEYQSTKGFFIESKPAYYFTGWGGYLVKYTIDGIFRGNIKLPGFKDSFDSPSFPMNYSYLNDSIFVCDFLIATGTESNALMIFNEKGKVLKMIPNNNLTKNKQKFVLRTGETCFYHFNNNLYFQSIYNDTVFQISVDKIVPSFILNRGKHSPPFESKWWSYAKQLQSNFIYLPVYFENNRFLTCNFYLAKNKYFALYDKSLRLLKVSDNDAGIQNDIDGLINITFDSVNSEGELIGIIQANELLKSKERNPEKFKGLNPKLKKLQNIKMGDNPIIIIARFKK